MFLWLPQHAHTWVRSSHHKNPIGVWGELATAALVSPTVLISGQEGNHQHCSTLLEDCLPWNSVTSSQRHSIPREHVSTRSRAASADYNQSGPFVYFKRRYFHGKTCINSVFLLSWPLSTEMVLIEYECLYTLYTCTLVFYLMHTNRRSNCTQNPSMNIIKMLEVVGVLATYVWVFHSTVYVMMVMWQ